jgi:hypothetical protein
MKSLKEILNEGLNEGLFNKKAKYKNPYILIEWNEMVDYSAEAERLVKIQKEIKDNCMDIVRMVLKDQGIMYSDQEHYNGVSTIAQHSFDFRHNIDVSEFEELCSEMFDHIQKMVQRNYKKDAHIEITEEFEEYTIWIPFTKGSTDGYFVSFYIGR